MRKLLSIIVPAYNMELYLENNLNTLIIKNSIFNSLEVLVINDGSEDKTLNIARQFEDKYPLVFKVIDKTNGNYGSCVNAGLKYTNGIFVKILDADDRFNNESLIHVINELQRSENGDEKVDLFFTDWHSEDVNNNSICFYKRNITPFEVIDVKKDSNKSFFNDMHHHAIIYRTSTLKKMNYRQTEGVSYTDQEWISLPLFEVNKIKYLPYDLYEYYLGRTGQSMDDNVICVAVDKQLIVAKELVDKFNNYKSEYPEFNRLIVEERILDFLFYIYRNYLIIYDFDNEIREFDNILKSKNREIFEKLGERIFSNRTRYKFIKSWRKSPNCVEYKLFRKIYLRTHNYN